jgi:carbamoyl-phosphate synthase small subunit
MNKKSILLLEDGTYYEGKAIGKIGTTIGELCFNTGMTGYQEIFTDPSYYGQVLIATNVHIGNYGIKSDEVESDNIKIAGFICRNFSVNFSRQQAQDNIQSYFEKEGLIGISDIDTRALVRSVRSKGAMNCIISSEIDDLDILKEKLAQAPLMDGLELATKVTTSKPYTLGDETATYRVAVLDYGTKQNILRSFLTRDCYVKVFPAQTRLAEINEWEPDGYFLSNGPGDPATMDYAIETAKNILAEDKPVFGICLGHQIISLALGLKTYKMHHGHRGINHPVKNLITGKCEITSQNHGFAVDSDNLTDANPDIEVTHINLNDGTMEGVRLKNKNVFSVQYHPEAAPGPHDSRYLFDDFVEMLRKYKDRF